MTTYKLNPETVKQADKGQTTAIDSTGAYTGVFTLAKQIVASSGTEGVEFTFQADDGRVARYLTLYTVKADGTEVFGLGMLYSLMTCLKVREIASEQITIEEWDRNANAKVPVDVENFTSLCNKPVGVLLQKSFYLSKAGEEKWKLEIYGFFDANTRLTATEILDKVTVPKALDGKIAGLKDKYSKDWGAREMFTSPAPAFPASAGDLSDLDDSLPF